MFNKDIRTYAKENNVFLWQVAKAMGISESTMTRRFRMELQEQEKQKVFSIIDKLSRKKVTE